MQYLKCTAPISLSPTKNTFLSKLKFVFIERCKLGRLGGVMRGIQSRDRPSIFEFWSPKHVTLSGLEPGVSSLSIFTNRFITRALYHAGIPFASLGNCGYSDISLHEVHGRIWCDWNLYRIIEGPEVEIQRIAPVLRLDLVVRHSSHRLGTLRTDWRMSEHQFCLNPILVDFLEY